MSDNPPGGWSVSEGVWGTDMDRETSIVREGANAIKYISTATATVRLQSDYHPVAEGQPYRVAALMRADNVTAKNVRFLVNWYTAAKVFISGNTLINGVLPAINTWYEIAGVYDAPATAAFARLKVGRSTASFNAYSAFARIRPHPKSCFAYLASAQSIPTGVFTYLRLETEDHDNGGIFTPGAEGAITAIADAGGGDITITSAGHTLSVGDAPVQIYGTTSYNAPGYTVTAVAGNTFDVTAAFVANETGNWVRPGYATAPSDGTFDIGAGSLMPLVDDGEFSQIMLWKNSGTVLVRGNTGYSSAANRDISSIVSAAGLELSRGDKIGATVYHDHSGAPLNVTGDAAPPPFSTFFHFAESGK